jgi:hypothetical protein
VRLVQDLVFLEALDFTIPTEIAQRARAGAPSIEEAVWEAASQVGLEVVDYGSVVWHPLGTQVEVRLRSRAWRERAERQTVAR